MNIINQAIYNTISQSNFDKISVFANPINGMVEPVISGTPESIGVTNYIEKVLKTISNGDLEWMVSVTSNETTLTFQRIHSYYPNTFLVYCKMIYLLVQPQENGDVLVSLIKREYGHELKEVLDNLYPIRTAVIPQDLACVLMNRFVEDMREDYDDLDAVEKIFD